MDKALRNQTVALPQHSHRCRSILLEQVSFVRRLVETVLTIAVGDENMKNLLMSWYYAGYYTGLYEGQQKVKPADEGK